MGKSIFYNPDYESPLGNWLANDFASSGSSTTKALTIRFLSYNYDASNYYLTFEIYAKNLNSYDAVIFVQEMNAFNEIAVPKETIELKKNDKTIWTGSFPRNKKFDKYPWQDGFVYMGTVECDGLSKNTNEFSLKNATKGNFTTKDNNNEKVKDKDKNTCFCNRDFTEQELKSIVVELRKNTTDQKGNKIYPVHKEKIFYLNVGKLSKGEQNNYIEFTRVLNIAFNEFNINSCIRKIHFLAQSYPETRYFSVLKEEGHKLKYDPFRGRGLIQLTAAKDRNGNWVAGITDSRTGNSTSYLGYKKYSEKDVVSNPDIISNSLYESARSGGWFWKYGKLLSNGSILDLNTLADKDNIDDVSHKVNGGSEAKRERKEAFTILKKLFNYDKCVNNKK
ncbi:MAG TPA: hypothetical protein VLZ83_11230 [Edaphocola sp.]|nr:hypothetical protein [Edaphocola sp.]